MVEYDSYSLDSDENSRYVELCFVVLPEQQHMLFDAGWVTTVRVYVAAAAKRAVVVKEDDLLAKADIQASPDKVSKALFAELKTWLDNKCFNIQEIAKASNITTSRYVRKWKFAQKKKGERERTIRLRWVLRGFMDLEAFGVEAFFGNSEAVEPEVTR
eukprot:8895625-Pyramimonas_sp.AAC.1